MQTLVETPGYDRRRLLNEAQRARTRRRYARAIALYQEVLEEEPDNLEAIARLAPVLALDGRHFEAWRRFREVGKALLGQRRNEWALAVFRDAAHCLPFEFDAWRITAELELKLGRSQLAYETLLEGRSRFRSAVQRDQAIALLELAREIEPRDLDVVIDLAHQLSGVGRVDRALGLLADMADTALRSADVDLRRVRWAEFRITWSPQHAWGWLATWMPRIRVEEEEPTEPAPLFDSPWTR